MTAQLDSLIGRSIELAAKLQAFDMAVSSDRWGLQQQAWAGI